jgi:hypothetical protein
MAGTAGLVGCVGAKEENKKEEKEGKIGKISDLKKPGEKVKRVFMNLVKKEFIKSQGFKCKKISE